MIKWYKEPYFDARTWLLCNFEKLNISNDELVFLLLVHFGKENRIKMSYEFFSKKLNMKNEDIDKIIASLVAKKYLKITTNAKGVDFNIDAVFEFDPNQYEIVENQDIYNTLDMTFKRPLTPSELQKASDLIQRYGEAKFNDALRTAEAYKKVNMNYIEAILKNDESKS